MNSTNQLHWERERLEQELATARQELAAMQELLEDLPEIFERKFQGRLQPLLEEQHRLLRDNASLRHHLLQLQPQADPDPAQPLLPGSAQPADLEPALEPAPAPRRAGLRRLLLAQLLPWRRLGSPADQPG